MKLEETQNIPIHRVSFTEALEVIIVMIPVGAKVKAVANSFGVDGGATYAIEIEGKVLALIQAKGELFYEVNPNVLRVIGAPEKYLSGFIETSMMDAIVSKKSPLVFITEEEEELFTRLQGLCEERRVDFSRIWVPLEGTVF